MSKNIKKLYPSDVLTLMGELDKTNRFDFLGESIKHYTDLIGSGLFCSDDLVVIGLALAFWSYSRDRSHDDVKKETHAFSPYSFYVNACMMEGLYRKNGLVGCDVSYETSAKFVSDYFDAAFVLINSLSRGFSIGYAKKFGNDRHLQYLAAVFQYHVLRILATSLNLIQNVHYYDKDGNPPGFDAYRRIFCRTEGDGKLSLNLIRENYCKFAIWVSRRFNKAVDTFCKTTFRGVGKFMRISDTIRRNAVLDNEAVLTGSITKVDENGVVTRIGKCAPKPEKDGSTSTKRTLPDVKITEKKLRDYEAKVEINGRELEIYHVIGDTTYTVVGARDGDIDILKKYNIVGKEFPKFGN